MVDELKSLLQAQLYVWEGQTASVTVGHIERTLQLLANIKSVLQEEGVGSLKMIDAVKIISKYSKESKVENAFLFPRYYGIRCHPWHHRMLERKKYFCDSFRQLVDIIISIATNKFGWNDISADVEDIRKQFHTEAKDLPTDVLEEVNKLKKLEKGWHDGSGEPMKETVYKNLLVLVQGLVSASLPVPFMALDDEGEVGLQWTTADGLFMGTLGEKSLNVGWFMDQKCMEEFQVRLDGESWANRMIAYLELRITQEE